MAHLSDIIERHDAQRKERDEARHLIIMGLIAGALTLAVAAVSGGSVWRLGLCVNVLVPLIKILVPESDLNKPLHSKRNFAPSHSNEWCGAFLFPFIPKKIIKTVLTDSEFFPRI